MYKTLLRPTQVDEQLLCLLSYACCTSQSRHTAQKDAPHVHSCALLCRLIANMFICNPCLRPPGLLSALCITAVRRRVVSQQCATRRQEIALRTATSTTQVVLCLAAKYVLQACSILRYVSPAALESLFERCRCAAAAQRVRSALPAHREKEDEGEGTERATGSGALLLICSQLPAAYCLR